MSFFSRKAWSVASVDRIDLEAGSEIDIGFLGGDEHRDAFVALFKKALADNPILGRAKLVAIDGKKPANYDLAAAPKLVADHDVTALGKALYESHNERIALHLVLDGKDVMLAMTFDNPSFWLDEHAA